jgi:hypothetical protein
MPHKKKEIAKNDQNDECIKHRKAGRPTSPPTKIYRCLRRGVGTILAWRLIGVTCLGCPYPHHTGRWR